MNVVVLGVPKNIKTLKKKKNIEHGAVATKQNGHTISVDIVEEMLVIGLSSPQEQMKTEMLLFCIIRLKIK